MKRRKFITNSIITGSGVLTMAGSPFAAFSHNLPKPGGKLGIALVGLGSYSTGQLAPALQETNHCYLAGIVTGTPSKEDSWSEKYNIPGKNIYNYQNFDKIVNNNDIDIIYVVLPNSMHAEFTIRAAEAGKHVICEKPMGISSGECRDMIAACNKANRKLSIGYRLHFDPYHLRLMEIGQHEEYGELKSSSHGFGFVNRNKDAWRLDKKLAGGGPLMDLGIYAIQSSIYSIGELPVQVTAQDTTREPGFYGDVEGSLEWALEFPSGYLAHGKTSYEEQYSFIDIETGKGTMNLNNAYFYGGIEGSTPEGPLNFSPINQQALQMDAFALDIKKDRQSIVPGEMGLRDLVIIEKIYEAAETGKTVSLEGLPEVLHKV